MQSESDDREAEHDTTSQTAFAVLDEIDGHSAFLAWELQTQSIAAIGELYVKLLEIAAPHADDVTKAIGNALVDIIEDWKPRNVATMASAIAAGSPCEPDK